jgi:ABC-type uncharacterized transport system permease subunit
LKSSPALLHILGQTIISFAVFFGALRAISDILQLLLPILYAVVLLGYGNIFFRRIENRTWLFPLVLLTIVAHSIYIGAYTIAAGHCLLTNFYEFFSLIAYTLVVSYAIVELKPKQIAAGTGMMVALVGFVFQLVSSLGASPDHDKGFSEIFKDPIFNTHVTSAVFGYAALTLATIYGSLYLLLYRSMRRNKFGVLFYEVPSLDHLERFGIRASAIGFIFLSVAIIFGAVLTSRLHTDFGVVNYLLDPKTLATVLIWLVFGVTLVARRVARLEGRKIVVLWMSGFGLAIISMTIINSFVTDFHNFL